MFKGGKHEETTGAHINVGVYWISRFVRTGEGICTLLGNECRRKCK